jgi:hypothetical protein
MTFSRCRQSVSTFDFENFDYYHHVSDDLNDGYWTYDSFHSGNVTSNDKWQILYSGNSHELVAGGTG